MSLSDPYRAFLDRVAQGSLDTIEMAQMQNGGGTYGFHDPELRKVGRYMAWGTLAHFFNLATQHGAQDDLQAVINKIAAAWESEGGAG